MKLKVSLTKERKRKIIEVKRFLKAKRVITVTKEVVPIHTKFIFICVWTSYEKMVILDTHWLTDKYNIFV